MVRHDTVHLTQKFQLVGDDRPCASGIDTPMQVMCHQFQQIHVLLCPVI